jgi:ferric iron reductase protein FhuF
MKEMDRIIINELKAFDIYLNDIVPNEIAIEDLLNENKCLGYLTKQMNEIKAPNLAVTASMIAKRYAYLVVSSSLYCMIYFNGIPNLPVHACTLSHDRKLYIQPKMFTFQDIRGKDREQWRELVLRSLFSNHITPFINVLHSTARIPTSILWDNVAVRINSIYRKMIAKGMDDVKLERLYSDFHFLKNASGDLFNLDENPIKEFLKIGEDLKLNPIRKTCCMYYKLEKDVEGIGFCANCPIRHKKLVSSNCT